MTKSERLFYILNLLKERGSIHVEELARKCDVSPRTVYRDIDTLLHMGIRIDYNNGYRLAPNSVLPGEELDATDFSIINCCLHSSLLYKDKYFKERIDSIEKKLRNYLRKDIEANMADVILLEPSPHVDNVDTYSIIAVFFKAIQIRRKVRVLEKNSSSHPVAYTPVAVRFSEHDVTLLMAGDRKQLIEMPVHTIESLELATIHFTHRPVELVTSNEGQ